MAKEDIFCSVLKREIEKQGVSIKALAEYVGVTSRTLKRYINGGSKPRATAILKISEYLNITIDYLLGFRDEFGNRL